MAMAWEGLTVAFAKGKKGSGCELGGWVRAGLPIPHTQITLYIYLYEYIYIYIYVVKQHGVATAMGNPGRSNS